MSVSGSRGTSAAPGPRPLEVATGVQADGTRHPCWNPVLFETVPGLTLMLFYKVGPDPQTLVGHDAHLSRQRAKRGAMRTPAALTPSSARSRIKPVRLSDGTLSGSPTSTESTEQPEQMARPLRAEHGWRQDLDDPVPALC